jgi:hypothetical protein
MPNYIYKNTETLEYRQILQTMKEAHEYFGEDGTEKTWIRVFTCPQASIDSHIDPFSSKQFVDKTRDKRGTQGDLWDRSNDLSSQRAQLNGGVDPVKAKYFENYSKARNGAKHLADMKTFESNKVKVDY